MNSCDLIHNDIASAITIQSTEHAYSFNMMLNGWVIVLGTWNCPIAM